MIWLVFNVSIALLLMEFGVFNALEKILGLLSNISIAWISAVAADLLICKPLGLSPKMIEFKRAFLPDLNPVGTLSTFLASVISILAYWGVFGAYAQAFSAFIALGLVFLLVPCFAKLYGSKHYFTRRQAHHQQVNFSVCTLCNNTFEREDMAYCPFYQGSICSLCCSLDSRCKDACKPGYRLDDYLEKLANSVLPQRIHLTARLRLIRFTVLFIFLTVLTSAFVGIIYYQDLLVAQHDPQSFLLLQENFIKVYASLLVFIGLCTWWLILNDESRRVAQEEIAKQTQRLLTEIAEHTKTDAKLQEATRAADRANIAKSRFLSNMSHEIRTPLNSIIGYAYILQKDPAIPVHRRQAVDILKRSGEHLSSLIEDILDIARIEACKFEIAKDIIDFPSFIEHILSIFKPQAENKNLMFSCQITNTLPSRVRGDEKRVGQILINLLGNAIKFTNAGEVVFRIGYSCGVTTFHIIDTGPGIEEDQLQNIFQPFTQVAHDNLVSGSGLGLTISKILTEIMGGELTVSSQPGQGSTFMVRLYLANLGAENEKIRQETIVGYHEREQKILVVDDQQEHRELIKEILEPVGFCLFEASSGTECLLKVKEHQPDLILLDLSMPDMDGLEIARRLRQQGFLLPIVVLSSNAYATDRVNAIHAGCNDFLAKPLQVSKLLNKLKIQLGLNWLHEGENVDVPLNDWPVNGRPLPKSDVITTINSFVRIGDLLGLNQYLVEFGGNNPEFTGFAKQLMMLSNEFRIAEIKKILNLTTEKLADYDYNNR